MNTPVWPFPLRVHPLRYPMTHPDATALLRVCARYPLVKGSPTVEARNAVMMAWVQRHNERLARLPREQRPTSPEEFEQELALFLHYARFIATGQHVVSFAPALAAQLRQTEVGDVPYRALQWPYHSCYVALGPQLHLDLWSQGDYVDGAYVTHLPTTTPPVVEVVLTTVRADLDYASHPLYLQHPDRYAACPFRFPSPKTTIREAVLQQGVFSYLVPPTPPSPPAETDKEGKRSADSIDRSLQGARKGHPNPEVCQAALRQIMNGLCYLSSTQVDVTDAYPPGTPSRLLRKVAMAATPKARARAADKMRHMGYVALHFCGGIHDPAEVETGPEVMGSIEGSYGIWRETLERRDGKPRGLIWVPSGTMQQDAIAEQADVTPPLIGRQGSTNSDGPGAMATMDGPCHTSQLHASLPQP